MGQVEPAISDPVQETRETDRLRRILIDHVRRSGASESVVYGVESLSTDLIKAGQQDERDMVAALIEAAVAYVNKPWDSANPLDIRPKWEALRDAVREYEAAAALREVKP